ncbi:uncharacterized protein LOC125422037 [Ziziphus jujuba]|uniref:Uncharacterized protein LOC125422037 n=1 Tax=Ziziphus jujuba TaxID=326968 RepID=A0ABM4A7Q0_ZIZJJ|nr:uncharacterized protein LOC125422037 [Ziziphus jujuba]
MGERIFTRLSQLDLSWRALNFQGIEMGFEEDDEVVEHDREADDNDDMMVALQDAAGYMDIDVDAYEGHIRDQDHRNKEFSGLFAEVESELYPGCTKFSALTFLVRLMHIKALNHWSNKSFSMLLELLKEALPEGTKLPKSYYKAKCTLHAIGLGYETIHACKWDCALFWKESAELDKCPICAEPRYKFQGTEGKRIPQKVLRYFPITPRLQRLFTSRHTAIDMRWHKEKCPNTNGVLRHPADGEAWKHFDEQYPIFAMDPRNVRLGTATDGLNPFSNLSPTAPEKDIDVYLRPMIDELKDLWTNGVTTYDISKKERFTMHAAVLWTIHDFPAYGTLSGWNTKGYKACPTCNEDTSSQALRSKICYMGHHRYLSINHAWRNNRQYDGKPKRRLAPRSFSGAEILQQLDRTIESRLGKHPKNNLDVMHIEKNICDNIVGTMLDIKGKSKDTDKARMDLKDLKIRKELHVQEIGDGYAINISKNMNIKDGKISGLKTHDTHVLLQQLFSVGIRPYIKKEIKYFSRCKYPMVTDELYSLACGPDYGIRSYSECVVNGVRYRTKVHDDRRVTQNCGIWVVSDHDGESCDFYGVIEDILDSEAESGDFEDADSGAESGAESEDYKDADSGTENEDNGEYNEETDNDSEDELLSNGETGEDTDSFA